MKFISASGGSDLIFKVFSRYMAIACCVSVMHGCASTTNTIHGYASGGTYETRPDFRRANTDKARALNDRAVEHLRANELEQAETLLKQALTADVMFGPAHNSLGKVYFETGRFYLAAWEFEYASKLMPHQPEPRNNLGLVFETVDRLDRAVEHYRAALELGPDHPEILGNLARAQLVRGDHTSELREQLKDIVLKDARPEWRAWAREKLALWGDG